MKRLQYAGIWIFFFLIPLSCTSLPEIRPLDSSMAGKRPIQCDRPFLKTRWQLVHSIKAVLPNGQRQSMLGTIFVSPEQGRVHCVLMTIEGLVLLDIESDPAVTVNRAVPPFDASSMQNGLIQDIRLLFLKPDGEPVETGTGDDRSSVCRYADSDGKTTDVMVQADGSWKIDQYSSFHRRIRSVQARSMRAVKTGKSTILIPQRLELTAHGIVGYKLSLDCIEAVPL